MPLIRKDRVWETSTTSGTGTYTVDGAKNGKYRAFSVCGEGVLVPYMATPVSAASSGWEIGEG
ncbi:MAG: hypothetical protein O2856_04060, partial [Planctomycetota bacterium]|nr:hypothetical protein [Planctomycetota bacterium]